MKISETLLPEFDHEMANTRKVLQRIPEDKLDWKAHPKSNTIGWVGMHLSELPSWLTSVMTGDSFDVNPPGGPPYKTPPAKSKQDILERFDKNVADARKGLAAAQDGDFFKPWSLLDNGKPRFTMPRMAVIRGFVLNHSIHHRAHLCVYLRLNNVPVPGLYGPSADDK